MPLQLLKNRFLIFLIPLLNLMSCKCDEEYIDYYIPNDYREMYGVGGGTHTLKRIVFKSDLNRTDTFTLKIVADDVELLNDECEKHVGRSRSYTFESMRSNPFIFSLEFKPSLDGVVVMFSQEMHYDYLPNAKWRYELNGGFTLYNSVKHKSGRIADLVDNLIHKKLEYFETSEKTYGEVVHFINPAYKKYDDFRLVTDLVLDENDGLVQFTTAYGTVWTLEDD